MTVGPPLLLERDDDDRGAFAWEPVYELRKQRIQSTMSCVAIRSFADKGTEDIFEGTNTKDARSTLPRALWSVARRKLGMIEQAFILTDLRAPPANHLEKLVADLHGYHSIRINQQYRVVFRWADSAAHEVLIVDYH